MKMFACCLLFMMCFVVLVLNGCSSSGRKAEESGKTSANETLIDTDLKTETGSATNNEPIPIIHPNSLALFATLTLGKDTQSLPVIGGNITWDSTQYKLIRYIPSAQLLDEFGWTSSKSYSKTYLYGITAGKWIYNTLVFTSSGRKDITRLDPKTGETIGIFGTFSTDNMYRGFAIVGDSVYYRTKIGKDLFGNRRSGGDLMMRKISETSPKKLLDYRDKDNKGALYGIGENLIAIVTNHEKEMKTYEIRKLRSETAKMEQSLITISSMEDLKFYEGTTALFWSEKEVVSSKVSIMKYSLSGSLELLFNIPINSPHFIEIDESQGKVLVVFRAGEPYVPYYYLYDMESKNLEQLDIDPRLYSTSIYGNGQFYITE